VIKLLNDVKNFFRAVAAKVLDLDDTVKPEQHLKLFEDYLDKFEFDTNTKDVRKFLSVLTKKHLVDDIVISTMTGSSIASVNGNAVSTAISGAALFNYVQSEHPKSESVLIKNGRGWSILFPQNDKLFIVKASSELSMIELRALTKEINGFLTKSVPGSMGVKG